MLSPHNQNIAAASFGSRRVVEKLEVELDGNGEEMRAVQILWKRRVPRPDERDLKCSLSLLYAPVTPAASERNAKASHKYFSNFDSPEYT